MYQCVRGDKRGDGNTVSFYLLFSLKQNGHIDLIAHKHPKSHDFGALKSLKRDPV